MMIILIILVSVLILWVANLASSVHRIDQNAQRTSQSIDFLGESSLEVYKLLFLDATRGNDASEVTLDVPDSFVLEDWQDN